MKNKRLKVIEAEWIVEEEKQKNEFDSIGIDISAPAAYTTRFLTVWCGSSVHKDDLNIVNLVISAPDLLKACIEAEKHHQGLHSEIGCLLRDVILKVTKS